MKAISDSFELQDVRKSIHQQLGADTLSDLHRPIPWLDALAVAVALSAFVTVFVAIAFLSPSLPVLLLLSVFQAWIIHTLGLIGHDLFVHRNLWQRGVGPLLSSIVFVPATMSGRNYRLGHLRHHAKIGTADDTEAGLADINTRNKRFLFLSFIGFKLARSGRWGNSGANGYQALIGADENDHKWIRFEKGLTFGFIGILLLLAIFAPWQVIVFGYVLPLFAIAPLLISLRILLEHAVLDPGNPYCLATPYRTGWLTQLLYFANPGDCHLMHHIFPRVPWYHMPRLVKLSWPILETNGVEPRNSVAKMLNGWFIKNYPHRTNWPV